jgi:hypothetical protein
MNDFHNWTQSELQRQHIQTLATTITAADKILYFEVEARIGPRSDEGQHEKQQGKKKKEKEKTRASKNN